MGNIEPREARDVVSCLFFKPEPPQRVAQYEDYDSFSLVNHWDSEIVSAIGDNCPNRYESL